MMRIVMNPGCGWECNVHPQPTLDDLSTSIFLARERNLRVLHLAGHGKRMCGFIWNRDDAATRKAVVMVTQLTQLTTARLPLCTALAATMAWQLLGAAMHR